MFLLQILSHIVGKFSTPMERLALNFLFADVSITYSAIVGGTYSIYGHIKEGLNLHFCKHQDIQ